MSTHLQELCDSHQTPLSLRVRSEHWRRLMPAMVSAGLLLWLVYRVSPLALAAAGSQLDWPRLCVVFSAMVAALYLWDCVCLQWLFAEPGLPLTYRQVLRARGCSYVASAVNYELGQGLLAWELARAQGIAVVAALSRCLLLAMHDVAVLLTLGLAGSWWIDSSIGRGISVFCAIGLAALLCAGVLARLLPGRWRDRWTVGRWRLWPGSWTWSHSLRLCGLRGIYFSIILAAVLLGLEVAPVPSSPEVAFGAVPVVLLADGLPISISGLGTRETALVSLMRASPPSALLAFSLIWSAVLLTGRLLIGLVHWWLLPGVPFGTGGPAPNGGEAA
jgi:hypothetical protein